MADVSRKLVDAVGDAFNNNDIDEVMRYFADDATFDQAAGPDVNGKRFEGKETIRGVFAGLFDNVETVHWETVDCHIAGNKAYCEYRRTAKLKSGEEQDFLSVDILTFKNDLIIHKDTYYKNRTT